MLVFLYFGFSKKFDVIQLTGEWNFPLFSASSYLVYVDETYILVDTGFWFHGDEIRHKLLRQLKGEPLDYIIITHAHLDHVGGLGKVKEYFPNAKVVIHNLEAEYLRTGITRIPNGTNWFSNLYMNTVRFVSKYYPIHEVDPVEPDIIMMKEKESNHWMTKKITNNSKIWTMPGHSDGSIAFVVKLKRTHCFIGDTIMNN